ncbi:MAG: hypothetical protein LC808_00990 [Actinobacteria bacterium]|nr:hypothetical protein [Actinomycetota bacterium]
MSVILILGFVLFMVVLAALAKAAEWDRQGIGSTVRRSGVGSRAGVELSRERRRSMDPTA